ncbi:MAG: crossover junction endodeoxyribonuclease RuvC [bacterium]|nr:crossover junction endodeoxyribonuclease RuvC [bacterium]
MTLNAIRYTPYATRVLAIDPGYERLGIAVLEKKESILRNSLLGKKLPGFPSTPNPYPQPVKEDINENTLQFLSKDLGQVGTPTYSPTSPADISSPNTPPPQRGEVGYSGKKILAEELLFSECFKTSSKLPHAERLRLIGTELENVIKKYEPKALAVEKLFLNTNHKTVMSVSEARGVILYEAARAGLKICEYTPLQIKIAVTGYGRSDKHQVISMISRLITLPLGHKKQDDEYDAIAVGLTFFATEKCLATRNL